MMAQAVAALRLVVAGHELAAEQLADRRLGDLFDEHVLARALEVGKSGGPAEFIEFLRLDLGAALDERTYDLAPAFVRQPGHGDFGYCRMQRQTPFDFDRRNILAAGYDHVVDPASDEEIAILVDHAGVPGEVPAAANGGGVGIGTAPVALEGFVSGNQGDNFAFLVHRRDFVSGSGAETNHPDQLVDAPASGRARLGWGALLEGERVDFGAAI